jgi:hypothetical protein
MARTYKRSIKVPQVDLLDWELIHELSVLLEGYRGDDGLMTFGATDSRGQYEEESLEAFRAVLEHHPEAPSQLNLVLWSDDPRRGFNIWWSGGEFGSGAVFTGEHEPDVVYVADRAAEMLERARQRREQRIAAEQRHETRETRAAPIPVPANSIPASHPPSNWKRWAYDPWVVTVGGGLVITAVVAAIVWLS